MSANDTDYDETTLEKGLLCALFSGCTRPTPGKIEAAKNDLRADKARREQIKKHRTDQKRDKAREENQEQTSDQVQLYVLLTDINTTLAANRERLRILDQYTDALTRHMQKLRDGETHLFNPDGTLVDQMAEDAIRAREDATGTQIDRSDAEAVQDVLNHYEDEVRDLSIENEALEQQIRDIEALTGTLESEDQSFASPFEGPADGFAMPPASALKL